MPAALERTDDIGTGVTAIINRFHPTTVAHRLATLMEMYPDSVFLGLGAGGAINENPLGNPWPAYPERVGRTAESNRIIRKLFDEEFVTYEGDFRDLDHANLYTGTDEAPPIHLASNGRRVRGWRVTSLTASSPSTRSLRPSRTICSLSIRKGVAKSDYNESFEDVEKTVLIQCSYADTMKAAVEPLQTVATHAVAGVLRTRHRRSTLSAAVWRQGGYRPTRSGVSHPHRSGRIRRHHPALR